MNSTIILRAHTEIAETRQQRRARERLERMRAERAARERQKISKWPPYALVFDCETRTDEKQSFTFGLSRLLRNVDGAYSECREEIIFYDPEELKPSEVRVLKRYRKRNRAEAANDCPSKILLLTKEEFVNKYFFAHAAAGNLICGFNLPFDISRIASDATKAPRLNEDWSLSFDYKDRKTGKLRRNSVWRIKINRKDGKIAFIRLSGVSLYGRKKKLKKRGLKKKQRLPQGRFLDLRTLAWALANITYNLKSLAKDLRKKGYEVPRKSEHLPTGKATPKEIKYCRQDVRVTAGILNALRAEFDCHPIDRLPDGVYSPASIFKAYLQKMGISVPSQKFRLSPKIQGIAAQAYYGGRSEVRIRLADVPVVHTDFLSEYPTVIMLMGLWGSLRAKRLRVKTATQEVKALLKKILNEPDAVFEPSLWNQFTGYALIEPDNDILPVRTEYNKSNDESNMGVNVLESADYSIWFAIPDLIASVLLGGKIPKIVKAIRIVPEGIQKGLHSIALRGKEKIDPISGNLYKSLIEAKEYEKKRDKDQVYFLKIMANAGYGIFIETTPKRVSKAVRVKVFSGEHHFKTKSNIAEMKGKFYCPAIASLITAGGRLLLAILEREVRAAGGTYLFCDTDSMAIVAEKGSRLVRLTDPETEKQQKEKALSWGKIKKVVAKFKRLNPYSFRDSILKVEKDSLKRQLYGFGVSAKRYCLFDNSYRIVHVSSHGLGYLYFPDSRWNEKAEAPEWVCEAWEYIIKNDPHAKPPSWSSTPAMMRLAMTTPKVQMWKVISEQQEGLTFRRQIKPLNFVLTPVIARHGSGGEGDSDGYPKGVDRGEFLLIAPFSGDSKNWYEPRYTNVYDGRQFNLAPLERKRDSEASPYTLEHIVRTHKNHAESKSLAPNGERCSFLTRGLLKRTPISAEGHPRFIGKETDRKWEQEEDPSLFEPTLVEYRPNETVGITRDARLRNRIRDCGLSVRGLAKRIRLNPSTIQNARNGKRIRKSSARKIWHFLKKLGAQNPRK